MAQTLDGSAASMRRAAVPRSRRRDGRHDKAAASSLVRRAGQKGRCHFGLHSGQRRGHGEHAKRRYKSRRHSGSSRARRTWEYAVGSSGWHACGGGLEYWFFHRRRSRTHHPSATGLATGGHRDPARARSWARSPGPREDPTAVIPGPKGVFVQPTPQRAAAHRGHQTALLDLLNQIPGALRRTKFIMPPAPRLHRRGGRRR